MTETPTTLREKAAQFDEANARRIRDQIDPGDCALSARCDSLNADLYRLRADLIEAGGKAWFWGLYDLEGNRVPAKLIDGRFGLCWAIVDPETDRFTGKFIGAFPERVETMRKKGFEERKEWAPARAKIVGSGKGLSGLCTARASVVRTDGGWRGGELIDEEEGEANGNPKEE